MNGWADVVLRADCYIWRLAVTSCCMSRASLLQYTYMVQVTRKDEREANENLIRRFNRKVLQSGIMANAKAAMRFSKDLSKTERRAKAIIRRERKADKLAKARLGIR
jgi:ribosomal protein S21